MTPLSCSALGVCLKVNFLVASLPVMRRVHKLLQNLKQQPTFLVCLYFMLLTLDTARGCRWLAVYLVPHSADLRQTSAFMTAISSAFFYHQKWAP